MILKRKIKRYLNLILKGGYLEITTPKLEKGNVTEQGFCLYIWKWHPVQLIQSVYDYFFQKPTDEFNECKLFEVTENGEVIEIETLDF